MQALAQLLGLTLLSIGFSGCLGLPLQSMPKIAFLLDPMSANPFVDRVYWMLLALNGAWLVQFFLSRLAAILAILLIGLKWIVLQHSIGL